MSLGYLDYYPEDYKKDNTPKAEAAGKETPFSTTEEEGAAEQLPVDEHIRFLSGGAAPSETETLHGPGRFLM